MMVKCELCGREFDDTFGGVFTCPKCGKKICVNCFELTDDCEDILCIECYKKLEILEPTKKTKEYEQLMNEMENKDRQYKFEHNWDYYDGYVGANYDKSTDVWVYRENLNKAFKEVNRFNKLDEKKQKELMENPYTCGYIGGYHIKFAQGYVDFYKDTQK